LDRDRLWQNDLARDFFLLVLRAVTFQPLRAATEGRDRTGALLLARGRAGDGQSATVALLSAARRTRRRDDDLLSRQDQRRTPGDPPPFILLADGCAGERCGRGDPRGDPRHGLGRARDRRGRRRFAAGKTPSRLVFRLTLEIGFLSAAKFLLALARFGGLAFEAVARLALAPRLGLGLLTAAILLLARASIKKSPVARLALL